MTAITLQAVSKCIKHRSVLNNVTISFPAQCISGIKGPNGSGKTMLLRAISGIIQLDSGSVIVFDNVISETDTFPQDMGFLIEPLNLWDNLTGYENLKSIASIRNKATESMIKHTLNRVGLNADDTRKVRSYSLGMLQRLCIAQAIMEQPRLILLDEPTNALDEKGKATIRQVLLEEKDRGATIVVVSHDAAEINSISDCFYQMNDGEIWEV